MCAIRRAILSNCSIAKPNTHRPDRVAAAHEPGDGALSVPTEIGDLREHFDRCRAVTLQHLERLADEQLSWRPRPDAFSCGQHFVHLVQTEDFYMRGLFQHDWDPERLRFPKALPRKAELREQLDAVRQFTLN